MLLLLQRLQQQPQQKKRKDVDLRRVWGYLRHLTSAGAVALMGREDADGELLRDDESLFGSDGEFEIMASSCEDD